MAHVVWCDVSKSKQKRCASEIRAVLISVLISPGDLDCFLGGVACLLMVMMLLMVLWHILYTFIFYLIYYLMLSCLILCCPILSYLIWSYVILCYLVPSYVPARIFLSSFILSQQGWFQKDIFYVFLNIFLTYVFNIFLSYLISYLALPYILPYLILIEVRISKKRCFWNQGSANERYLSGPPTWAVFLGGLAGLLLMMMMMLWHVHIARVSRHQEGLGLRDLWLMWCGVL